MQPVDRLGRVPSTDGEVQYIVPYCLITPEQPEEDRLRIGVIQTETGYRLYTKDDGLSISGDFIQEGAAIFLEIEPELIPLYPYPAATQMLSHDERELVMKFRFTHLTFQYAKQKGRRS